MATLGEFGSLLQLGFGVGVGLSLFRAPMELRANALARAIEAQLGVVKGVQAPKARERSGKLASLKLKFVEQRRKLNRLNRPFMVLTIAFALLNLAALIWASVDASHVLLSGECNILLFVSVGSYVAIFAALEGVAQWLFWGVAGELRALSPGK
jgi:hypothetical protein